MEASKIENTAKDVVYKCDEISEQADSQLKQSQASNDLSLASVNTFTDTGAVKAISSISSGKREILLHAKSEPFLSRIIVEDEDGVQSTYFICRKTPINGVENAVSYDAPLGRLASLEIGSDLSLNNGRNIEVIEKAQVFLKKKDNQWDSINTILEVDESGPVTIKSLLPYLGQEEESLSPEEILASLIAEEEEQINVVKGRQKSLITKIQLRDQPILDQYQDEVFRLPLESQLFLTGPAGTGKTTTLIRRLGQKLSHEGLDDAERHILQTLEEDTSIRSDDSWMMFTPTKLLKQYLKEAFSREKVPASDRNIQTWKNFSNDIAKNTFSILRSSTSSGFILRENLPVLNESASSQQIKWFVDFSEWQFLDYLTELEKSASSLKGDEDPKISKIADELIEMLNASGFEAISTFFINLEKLHERVLNEMTALKKFSNEKISRSLILQMNTNSQFLDELSDMLDSIRNDKEDELEELDEDDSEEAEDALPSNRNRKKVAMNAYIGAIKTKAKSISQKRKIAPTSKNALVLDWIGERRLSDQELEDIGSKLVRQSLLAKFVNPLKKYMSRIGTRYRRFRSAKRSEWYLKQSYKNNEIVQQELDAILLELLKGTRELLNSKTIWSKRDETFWSPLLSVAQLHRNQVLVDEATDFSAIQLACMYSLSQPRVNSFFACGDFNQRLTTWGAKNTDEFKWVLPQIQTKNITISYRQSVELNDLAKKIIQSVSGEAPHIELPNGTIEGHVKPALLENDISPTEDMYDWLSARIIEIEKQLGFMPSTAIFVTSEESVEPFASKLAQKLEDHNINVSPCLRGEVIGEDTDIRVFDIQHIKGLEFEAVFFVNVDELAELHPTLFDKYLYVGITRAASYLGITCATQLPEKIRALRSDFVSDWA